MICEIRKRFLSKGKVTSSLAEKKRKHLQHSKNVLKAFGRCGSTPLDSTELALTESVGAKSARSTPKFG